MLTHVLMWLRLTETLFQLITQSWRALTGRSADEGFITGRLVFSCTGLHVLLVKLFDINRNHKHVDGINQLTMTYIHVQCTFNIHLESMFSYRWVYMNMVKCQSRALSDQMSSALLCGHCRHPTDRHNIKWRNTGWKIYNLRSKRVYV